MENILNNMLTFGITLGVILVAMLFIKSKKMAKLIDCLYNLLLPIAVICIMAGLIGGFFMGVANG